ncbi:M48 family metalloprotease [Oligoflexus tunisiensis]|uniref:M48 family metalloprotease n=1 Tax=Oligoflexus tunisiensis TaxID=708132 RepID=UPI00114D1C83|nr:M48 family metalloprotease [Oligoflexus tunisiensis]
MQGTQNRMVFLTVFLALMSCQQSQTNQRIPRGQTPNAANPQTTGEPSSSTPDADGNGDQTSSNPDSQVKPGDEGPVPDYLFSLQQAQAIEALVDPYLQPPFPEMAPPGQVSTNYAQLRTFIEGFSNRVFALPNLTPGRTFKVTIMEDDVFNAFADGYQNIIINTGFVKNSGVLGSLEILCHETAHSSKNHASKNPEDSLSAAQKTAMNQFYNELNTYMNQAFNPNGGVYTHNRNQYLQLRQKWDQIGPAIGKSLKRHESEADVVGAMICAELGLTPNDLLSGMKDNNKVQETLVAGQPQQDPTKIPDQERIPMTMEEAQEFAQFFLFPVVSHPTNAEREKQIERVMPAIQKRYRSNQTFANEWKTEFASQKGLSLTGGPDLAQLEKSQVISLTSASGRTFKIVKPLGCKHDWLRN